MKKWISKIKEKEIREDDQAAGERRGRGNAEKSE